MELRLVFALRHPVRRRKLWRREAADPGAEQTPVCAAVEHHLAKVNGAVLNDAPIVVLIEVEHKRRRDFLSNERIGEQTKE